VDRPLFKLNHGQVLDFAGSLCRHCHEPATHFVFRPVEPTVWIAKQRMQVNAIAFCDNCSPAVMPSHAIPEPIKASWFTRLQRAIGSNAV
jgi:hypothetical protein